MLKGIDMQAFEKQEQTAPWLPEATRAYCITNQLKEAGSMFDEPPSMKNLVLPKDTDYGDFNYYDYNCAIEPSASS